MCLLVSSSLYRLLLKVNKDMNGKTFWEGPKGRAYISNIPWNKVTIRLEQKCRSGTHIWLVWARAGWVWRLPDQMPGTYFFICSRLYSKVSKSCHTCWNKQNNTQSNICRDHLSTVELIALQNGMKSMDLLWVHIRHIYLCSIDWVCKFEKRLQACFESNWLKVRSQKVQK